MANFLEPSLEENNGQVWDQHCKPKRDVFFTEKQQNINKSMWNCSSLPAGGDSKM